MPPDGIDPDPLHAWTGNSVMENHKGPWTAIRQYERQVGLHALVGMIAVDHHDIQFLAAERILKKRLRFEGMAIAYIEMTLLAKPPDVRGPFVCSRMVAVVE
jgi:hypothetical protein